MTDDLSAPDAAEPPVDDVEQARRIQEFWVASRTKAGLGRLTNVVVAASWGEEVPPPAWSFGDSPELADELLALVLRGQKTGTSSAVVEYEAADEPVPAKGDLSILLDGRGEPRALVRTSRVDVVAFDDVTEEFAASEGEGDRTLASWRADHEAFWRRTLPALGLEFDLAMDVVCERFELLYAAS
ncbi:ASCH domain-containing protein [Xylanimonas protaetiae]|uniref:ASCH domain-containing protein n=1 Tax=Xylanimonas protaetiae TaxID=2509457 RepID=A0A4P6EZ15_9MICO|nr:ASCH domain-containing protein [Xylanimonas protaetiae]QAY68690.1 ASCH domain-containing protein [Xylanimonas protaetiae]